MQYPLGEHEKERITSKTGKKLTDITLDEVMKGHVGPDDIKISKEMLKAQGQVAREADNAPMEKNFERAEKYDAKNCARLVMEAAEVYEKRGILL